MKSLSLLGLALSLSLATAACAGSPDEGTTGDEAAVSAAASIELSDHARSVSGGILAIAGGVFRPVDDPSADILVKFSHNTLTGVHVAKLPNGARKFYLDGLILQGGDIVEGSEQLVIDEQLSGFEAPPSYSARLSKEERPAGTTMLSRNDVRLVRALLDIVRGAAADRKSDNAKHLDLFVSQQVALESTTITPRAGQGSRFVVKGVILVGGDVVTGSATMTIEEEIVPAPFGFGTASLYTVRTTISE